MEKEILNQFKTKDFWFWLGFTIIDGEILFFRSLFSFSPKKHDVKLQRYRVQREELNEYNYLIYSGYEYFWQFKEIVQ